MARPKTNPDDKKVFLIQIKFSVKDKLRLKDMANNKHLPLSTMIRQLILERLNGS